MAGAGGEDTHGREVVVGIGSFRGFLGGAGWVGGGESSSGVGPASVFKLFIAVAGESGGNSEDEGGAGAGGGGLGGAAVGCWAG